ncbi:MAG: Septum formation protein Maf [Anaerolineae bacterium]|nr:MAG: Septum formation protein Maf [Anaerolineae bacterium]
MLVLASNSPRRRQLLALLGLPFTVCSVEVDETPHADENPGNYVQRLSRSKAQQAAHKLSSSTLILAADTTVAMEEAEGNWLIFGKPRNAQEAEEMLRRLRGRTHLVFTGLALLRNADGSLWEDVCISEVPIRNFSDEEMQAYIASGDPFDKAGAYAIQHAGFQPVENFSGCFANVMGLPLCHLARLLARAGILVEQRLALRCLQSFDYTCTVTERLG